MDIYEAIEKRRTIRKFKGPANEDQLKRIINAGTKAPSAANEQGWEFILVDETDLIRKIQKIKSLLERGKRPGGEGAGHGPGPNSRNQNILNPPTSLVLIYYPKADSDEMTLRYKTAGVWACIQNMLLAATAEGLGSRIMSFYGRAVEEIAKLVHAPKDMELATAIHFGLPAEEPPPRTLRSEGSAFHINHF